MMHNFGMASNILIFFIGSLIQFGNAKITKKTKKTKKFIQHPAYVVISPRSI